MAAKAERTLAHAAAKAERTAAKAASKTERNAAKAARAAERLAAKAAKGSQPQERPLKPAGGTEQEAAPLEAPLLHVRRRCRGATILRLSVDPPLPRP